ncbi:hypothetical protein Tco_1414231 [Tanacetum coccineum]
MGSSLGRNDVVDELPMHDRIAEERVYQKTVVVDEKCRIIELLVRVVDDTETEINYTKVDGCCSMKVYDDS